MKKYVITGGPGIGKTTVIELLASMDYEIVPETARIIIEEQKLLQEGVFPWDNLEKFQEIVASRQIEQEEKINRFPVFLDRSIIDGHGYAQNGRVKTPDQVLDLARGRYDKVFILEPLSSYETDSVRFEDIGEAKQIHDSIIKAYEEFGYEPIYVPVLPPEERVRFILDQL